MDFQPMSPDEIERTMQFLLNQQVQFAADFEKLSAKTDRIAEGLIGVTGIVGRLAEQASQHAEAQAAAKKEADQRFKETDAQLKDLGNYIRTVEAHLNVVIDMFERHLRDDHGRRPS